MVPFDSETYIQKQTDAIFSRMRHFGKGRLYLEVGGKFLFDEHAERVLPGFDPISKVKIIRKLGKPFDIIVSINSLDLENGRTWRPGIDYEHALLNLLTNIRLFNLPKPRIAVNLFQEQEKTHKLINRLKYLEYEVYKRYAIENYPEDVEVVVSENGFGKDEHIPSDEKLIVVVGLGSGSGKLSTCLGQIYLDREAGLESGYAKYELFPIWNLPMHHPVNLAYEAATVDIGDFNAIDYYHKEAHGVEAINYNRDIQAFNIIRKLVDGIVSPYNQMRAYKSPTDMGINMAGYAIQDQDLVVAAAIIEIKNRIREYNNLGTPESKEWAHKCELLLEKAQSYHPTLQVDI